MLYEMLHFKDNVIKQYIFGLLGDLQKHCSEVFKLHLPQFIMIAIEHLYYNSSVGEVA